MQTLRMTTQLHTTIPAKKGNTSRALPSGLGSAVSCSSLSASHTRLSVATGQTEEANPNIPAASCSTKKSSAKASDHG